MSVWPDRSDGVDVSGMRVHTLGPVVVLVLAGCAGRFTELSDAEQNVFHRCTEAIYPAICGYSRDVIYSSICARRAADDYAEREDTHSRREWLVAHGCPPPMVEPEAYLSGGYATSRARQPPPPARPPPPGSRRVCVLPSGRLVQVPASMSCASQDAVDFSPASPPR